MYNSLLKEPFFSKSLILFFFAEGWNKELIKVLIITLLFQIIIAPHVRCINIQIVIFKTNNIDD